MQPIDGISRNIKLALVPEGPVAFDGKNFRYSKGEHRYIEGLAGHFKEITIFAFVYRPGDIFYEACSHSPFQSPNIQVVELPGSLPNPTLVKKIIQFIRVFWKLTRFIPKFDALYLFLPGYPSAMAWMIGRAYRKPHFVYAADDWEQATPGMFKWEHLRGTWFYRLFAWTNSILEKRIACTSLFNVTAGKALLGKYQRFGRPVAETTPRMTLSPSNLYPRHDTCLNEEIRLINVGSLIFDKAQHHLITALGILSQKHSKRIRLDILGEGPREVELRELASQLEIERQVIFHGHIQSEENLYNYYHKADIFVLSSVSEGFPRVLYEAMAMYLPIVTTNCGGIPLLMKNEHNALVVGVNDPSAIAAAIERVIDDVKLRRRLIANAASTIEAVFARMDPIQIPRLLDIHGQSKILNGKPEALYWSRKQKNG